MNVRERAIKAAVEVGEGFLAVAVIITAIVAFYFGSILLLWLCVPLGLWGLPVMILIFFVIAFLYSFIFGSHNGD